ncbi:hypothetical protein EV715DRAFT_272090 [Schizophyllum commune]
MAHIVEVNNREIIRVPLAALELPSNLPAVPLVVQQGNFSSTPCNDDSSLMATLLRLDRRSLFTGSTVDLEVAYLIPPNEDPSENARVEEVCNRLGLGGNDRSFRTDGLMNTFLLESSIRTHLDGLATFLITLPLEETCRLLDQLRFDNDDWAARAKRDPSAERILGRYEPRRHTYEIGELAFYALSPAFLSDDASIQILTNNCRTLDRPCPSPVFVTKKPRYNGFICKFPYPPSHRAKKDKLPPLALLVNSHYKLQTYMAREPKSRRSCHLESYAEFLNDFMELLYFTPSQDSEVASEPLITERNDSPLGISNDDVVFNLDDARADILETPDEEDLINGLTIQEMDSAIRQASNPRSTDAARAQAAMLMFGMAGDHRLPDNPLMRRW